MSPSTRFKPLFLSLLLATFSSALSLPHTSHTPHPAFGRGSYGLSTNYSTIASSDAPTEADLLPQPQPSDYQFLTQRELSSLFDVFSDNDGIGESWHGHRSKKRALGKGWNGITSLKKAGLSGVAAMRVCSFCPLSPYTVDKKLIVTRTSDTGKFLLLTMIIS